MRRGLVGHDVGEDAAPQQLREHVARVADQADRVGFAPGAIIFERAQCGIEVVHHGVDVAVFEPPLGAPRIDFDDETHAFVHRDRQRLRAAHLAQSGGERELPLERRRGAEVLPGQRTERLVSPLQDALRADVDPRTGRHLPVHDQPGALPLVEVLLRGPRGDDIGVGDQHTGRVLVGLEDGDRLARLHQQGVVHVHFLQRFQDGVERLPVAGGFATSAVDDEVVGVARHFGVEVILQHTKRRFQQPILTV